MPALPGRDVLVVLHVISQGGLSHQAITCSVFSSCIISRGSHDIHIMLVEVILSVSGCLVPTSITEADSSFLSCIGHYTDLMGSRVAGNLQNRLCLLGLFYENRNDP